MGALDGKEWSVVKLQSLPAYGLLRFTIERNMNQGGEGGDGLSSNSLSQTTLDPYYSMARNSPG